MIDPLAVIDGWPARAAVGVVNAEGTLASRGPVDAVFAWASVTKLLTSLSVLIAVEEGSVDLDEPAGPPGSTVRHLLSHASGLDRDTVRVVAPAGTRRIYSNTGIELAAASLEAGSGLPFATYVNEAVLGPLEMTGTRVDGSPASSARGPLIDLMALAGELLAPRLIAPATLAAATAVHFPGLDGILPGFGKQTPNDWGLGFEVRSHKRPHWTGSTNSPATFGHFGLTGSFLWVDPVAGVAGAGLADLDFGPWAQKAWPLLADGILCRYA